MKEAAFWNLSGSEMKASSGAWSAVKSAGNMPIPRPSAALRASKPSPIREVVQFCQAVLRELPAPVNANEQQEGRLQAGDRFHKSVVHAQNLAASFAHGVRRSLPGGAYRRGATFSFFADFSRRQKQPSADQVWNHFSTCAARSARAIGELRKAASMAAFRDFPACRAERMANSSRSRRRK